MTYDPRTHTEDRWTIRQTRMANGFYVAMTYILAIAGIIFIVAVLTGCSGPIPLPHTNEPGTATYTRNVVVKKFPTSMPTEKLDAMRAIFEETTTETLTVTQPENPNSAASIKTPSGATASVPGSYTAAQPQPPSPTAKALGGLVWLGGILAVVSALSLFARGIPGIGFIVPIGYSAGGIGVGIGLMLISTWLDEAPTWQKGAIILAGVGIGYVVAVGDNLRAKMKSKPTEPTA